MLKYSSDTSWLGTLGERLNVTGSLNGNNDEIYPHGSREDMRRHPQEAPSTGSGRGQRSAGTVVVMVATVIIATAIAVIDNHRQPA